jgi:LysM repeat protein
MVVPRSPVALLASVLVLAVLVSPEALAETYTMKEGDTLWEIARVKYGDPSFWVDLQKANNISNTRTIPNGTVITLPSKATLQKLRGVTDPAERARILKEDGGAGTGATTPAAPPGPTPFDPVSGLSARTEVPRSSVTTR